MRALSALEHRRRPQGGFTLIELLVVIVILGLLAAIVVFATRGTGDRGKEAAIGTDERTIRTALEVFCARNSRYPGGPAAPDPFKANPMGELVAGKYLSNPSTYHQLSTGDNTPEAPNAFPEGKCPGTPKNYLLDVALPGSTVPPPPSDYIAVSAGREHSLRLKGDGTVFASGSYEHGQLGGDGTEPSSCDPQTGAGCIHRPEIPTLVQVKGEGGNGYLENVKAVAAGNNFSVALDNDGTVWTWGSNTRGALGDGSSTSNSSHSAGAFRATPGPAAVSEVDAISTADLGNHVMALKNGEVWTWGSNNLGQLGDDSPVSIRATPVQVKAGDSGFGSLTGVTAIDAGRNHSLAVKDGAVWAWGSNSSGQLGDGSQIGKTTPVRVAGLDGSPVTAIAAGDTYSVALKADHTVWVWGRGTTNPPVQVLGGVTGIDSGTGHVLASKDGEVWAWGENGGGQLGIGSDQSSATPVQVKGVGGDGALVSAAALSGGTNDSMAVMRDGKVLAWGKNESGQFGFGHWMGSSVPTGEVAGPLINDVFATRTVLVDPKCIPTCPLVPQQGSQLNATSGGAPGHNFYADREDFELSHAPVGSSAGKSVWYEFTVPPGAAGRVEFATRSSDFDTTMGVYTTFIPDPSVSDLVPVERNDDYKGTKWSGVVVPANPGVTYFIAVDGSTKPGADADGGIWFGWESCDPTRPQVCRTAWR